MNTLYLGHGNVRCFFFIETLEQIIEKKNNLMVVGDMNLNLLDNSLSVKKYTDLLIPNGFVILNDIVPMSKDGNPLLATNYRPISLLPVLSKIFESVLHSRLNDFILRTNVNLQ